MLLDIDGLRKNYYLLIQAKISSQGRPKGLVADTRGELFLSNSAWGWWTRILGGLSGEKTLRIAIEKTYRALDTIPGMVLELRRSGSIDEKLGPLKIFPQTPEQIISQDRKHIEPFVDFVQQIHDTWQESEQNKDLGTLVKKFEKIAYWLRQCNLALACQRISSEEVQSCLEAYKSRAKVSKVKNREEDEQEILRLDLVASQENVIEEQLLLIEALKAQLAANSHAPNVPEASAPSIQKKEEKETQESNRLSSFEAAIRDEVKRLDQIVTKIEQRRGMMPEEPPAPLTMVANLGGKIAGGFSKHDIIEQFAQLNKRLANVVHIVVSLDSSTESSPNRILELEEEIDRLSDSLLKASEELARKEKQG